MEVALALLLLAILATVPYGSSDKNARDEFVQRWPLEGDLPCIHQEVGPLGPDPKARPGEPNWRGSRTYCFFLQETVSYVSIYKWPTFDDDGVLGIAFIRRISPDIPYVREGDSIPECRTLTEIKSSLPSWIRSPDTAKVNREIKRACFYMKYEVGGPAPIKLVFRVTRKSDGLLEARTTHYLLPDRPDYKTYQREAGVNGICTRCNAGGGFAQPILVSSRNLTDVLQKIKEKHSP